MKLNNQKDQSSYLSLNWPNKPENVQSYTTLIAGGFSTGDYSQYNLAAHVGDDMQVVKANRVKLVDDLKLPAEPVWLEQVHSDKVVCIDELDDSKTTASVAIQADASVSRKKGAVCAVLTADCLPVFFCNQNGTEVAVAHAGWRGLHAGIISNTIKAMFSSPDEILVSLGPAIGPQAFEVGDEVFEAFVDKNRMNESAFVETRKHHYLCDIYQLARIELQSIGVTQIAGENYCTYSEPQRFYSYRRQKNTGRMASVIWLV
jgi:YfiH family protein